MTTNNTTASSINPLFIINDAGYSALQDNRILVIFIVATILFLTSLLGNLFTVITLCRTTVKSTFVALWCLAFTDIFAVCSRYVYIHGVYFIDFDSCWTFTVIFTGSFLFMNCSSGQVVILSMLRFFLVVYPLKSLKLASHPIRRIASMTVVNWTLNCAIAALYGRHKFFQCMSGGENPKSYISEAIWATVVTMTPLVIIGVLHIVKIRVLKKSLAQNMTKSTRRMSIMVTLIVIIYVISILPMIITQVVNFCVLLGNVTPGQWFPLFVVLSTLFLFLNHIVNPVIFFMFSPPARRAFRKLSSRQQSGAQHHSSSLVSTKTTSCSATVEGISYRANNASSEERH